MDEIEALKAELARLRTENERLRAQLPRPHSDARTRAAGIPTQLRLPLGRSADPVVTKHSSLAARVALFRRLFAGRDDVYALRWEPPGGRPIYMPAALSSAHRRQHLYLPLTDAEIEQHLAGRLVVGVYPLLRGDRCWFVAADFDHESWRADGAAYLSACAERDVPAALERSRSGDGAHVWIFFSEPVPAAQARRLGESLLTRAMARRATLDLDSYDRLFPNQDTLPRGGLGNLIALPLQLGAARHGNSLFVDPATLAPFRDQWAFLSGVRRVALGQLDALVKAAQRAGTVLAVRQVSQDEGGEDPWTRWPSGRVTEARASGPFPESVRATLSNLVYVDKTQLSPALRGRLWRLAAFPNPEFHRRQALRFSTFGTPRVIHCAEDFDRHIALPRGLLDDVRELLSAHGIVTKVTDERTGGVPLESNFRGDLTPAQHAAAEALLAADCGVCSAPTAFGKTVLGTWMISRRRVNTLIVVHRQVLVDQWRAHLTAFLDLPPRAIGQFGAGRKKTTGQVDIALFPSLSRGGSVADLVADYGHVIVDECHHVPAKSFEAVLRAARARYVLGLTATPTRRDGQHPIIVMQCGRVRFRVEPHDEAARRPFAQVVIPRPTGFRLSVDDRPVGIQAIYATLAVDEARNAMICRDVRQLLAQGRVPLVLTERIAHLEALADQLGDPGLHLAVFRGGMGSRQRAAAAKALKAIPEGAPTVLLATGRFIGEGFDDPRPDTLLLTMPVSWRGTVWQYAGRISRPRPGKHEVRIYDYADLKVPMLASMHRKRLRAYRAAGYTVQAAAKGGGAVNVMATRARRMP